MGTSIREKFKSNFKFVKPLYQSEKRQKEKDSNRTPICFDRTVNLGGHDLDVKTVITEGANVVKVKGELNKECKVILPGACNSDNKLGSEYNIDSLYNKVLNEKLHAKYVVRKEQLKNMLNISRNNSCTDPNNQVSESWLRIYPAPKLPGETICSVIFRCVACQLGLTAFLTLWTIIAVFLINYFEGPNEIKVSLEFEKNQNQLVIDLATELRQVLELSQGGVRFLVKRSLTGTVVEVSSVSVRGAYFVLRLKKCLKITPISSKWREAIERRIEDERKLTVQAVGLGAKIKPGIFWNLSGTFLFAVYVMTALGFGAPIPRTVPGRVAALLYAILAAPTHIYLMFNASTCVVIRLEGYEKYLRSGVRERATRGEGCRDDNESRSPRKTSEAAKKVHEQTITHTFLRGVSAVVTGHCVPLAIITYYTFGLLIFGVLRQKSSMEAVMFPLEFTTTGGLEFVEGYVRVLYGLYVEGAMWLFACTLAALRRRGNSAITIWGERYRLFEKND